MTDTVSLQRTTTPGWGAAVLGYSVLSLGAGVLLATLVARLFVDTAQAAVAAQLTLWLALGAAVVFAVKRDGTGSFVNDLRLRVRPIDVAIGLLFGLGLQLFALVIGQLSSGGFAFSLPSIALFNGRLPAQFWLTSVVIPIVCAPLVEELFFRGLLQRTLASIFNATVAVLASAAGFAALHLITSPSLTTGLITFMVGLACGVLVQLTGRLGTAISVHAGFNASAVALLLLGTFI